jgi:hypothetical protein
MEIQVVGAGQGHHPSDMRRSERRLWEAAMFVASGMIGCVCDPLSLLTSILITNIARR